MTCTYGATTWSPPGPSPTPAAPGLVTAGEMGTLTGGGTTFAVTYGNGPGIVIDLHDEAAWQHVVVTLPDAQTLAARLTPPLR